MANFKFITDVSQIGLLQGLARTRRSLVLSTLGGLALTYGTGFAASWFISEASWSVVMNVFVITGVMFLVLIASYLLTVLIGDLSFAGPWREAVFLEDGGVDKSEAPVANHNGEFLIILVVCIVANAFGLNIATGGFLEQYHNVGYFKVRMRSPSPQLRINGLTDLTKDANFSIWSNPELQAVVLDGFDDPSPEVRKMALWSAGKIELHEARERIIEVMRTDEHPGVRGKAAVALGKLGLYPESRRAVEAMLREAVEPAARVGALRGLGLMASPRSVEVITPLFDAEDDEVMTHAFWAIRQIGSEKARPAVRAVVDADPGHLKRCAAWDALKLVANEDDVLWARRQYQRPDDLGRPCEMRVWEEPHNESHRIVIGDTFREKLIKIVANEAPFEYRSWFQRIVNDPSSPYRLREVASEVIGMIREAEMR